MAVSGYQLPAPKSTYFRQLPAKADIRLDRNSLESGRSYTHGITWVALPSFAGVLRQLQFMAASAK
jgi:hypothetical protein